MNIRPPFLGGFCFGTNERGSMTKSDRLKVTKTPDIKANEAIDEELFNIPDSSYTQFTYSENADEAFSPALNRQIYPDNLPEDNVEAVLILMKKSLKMSNDKKK